MKLEFTTAKDEPRVHVARLGVWVFVVRPFATNRFGAWVHRIGWDRGSERYFRKLSEAFAWLQAEADKVAGRVQSSDRNAQL